MNSPSCTRPHATCMPDVQTPSVLSRGDSAVLKEGEGFKFCRGFNGTVRVASPIHTESHPRDNPRECDNKMTQADTNVTDGRSCRGTPNTGNFGATIDNSSEDQGGGRGQGAAHASENHGQIIEMSEPVKVELDAEPDSGKDAGANAKANKEQPKLREATSTETQVSSRPNVGGSSMAIVQDMGDALAVPLTESGGSKPTNTSTKVKQELCGNDASNCTVSANDQTAKPAPDADHDYNGVPAKRARALHQPYGAVPKSMEKLEAGSHAMQDSGETRPLGAGCVSSVGMSIDDSARDTAPPSQPECDGQVPGSYSLRVHNTLAVSSQFFCHGCSTPAFCRRCFVGLAAWRRSIYRHTYTDSTPEDVYHIHARPLAPLPADDRTFSRCCTKSIGGSRGHHWYSRGVH